MCKLQVAWKFQHPLLLIPLPYQRKADGPVAEDSTTREQRPLFDGNSERSRNAPGKTVVHWFNQWHIVGQYFDRL